ncbi:MAG: hypothetical protein LAO55_13530 [Acidobacteriia bacterium]|nr:hypothetical protein [Terriglobia bacterium]
MAILGLLACGGVWAQSSVSVTVGLSESGPLFLVDGQIYSSPQIFQWAVGSTHQIYFIQSEEADGSLGNHQYPQQVKGVRYTFGGWNLVGQDPLGAQPLLVLSVEPTLTAILGQVTTEVAVYVYFNGFTDPALPCSPTAVPNDPREGVAVVGGTCFSSPGIFWMPPGPLSLVAAPFPGYIFTNWLIGDSVVPGQSIPEYQIVMPTNIAPAFVKAKRARFRSNPLGLSLLVDHQLVKPGPLLDSAYSGDPYCPVNFSVLPIGLPVGYVPLCVGDFDFMPGSQHVIGAPPVQTDADGKTWVFTGFSNGMGQNDIYIANFDVYTMDTVYANFIPGVPTRVVTSPPGLTVQVDNQNDSKGSVSIWAAGQTHHLVAAETQTDASGRPWKFVSWSNGGSADQSYTVPAGLNALTLTANYEPLGKLQVLSVPSGLHFTVDGAACTTPCILLDKATGTDVQVVAPASVAPNPNTHYDFRSWNDGNPSNTFQVTIGDQAQVFTATYQAFYKLTASSLPANHAAFLFNPASADGFYTAGTQVGVTVLPSDGFSFKNWFGDLAGTDPTASVLMNGPRSALAVLGGFPVITDVNNAAGDTPSGAVGPGSDISILGENLAATSTVAPQGQLSQSLGDVWVTLNDRLMALMYVSPQQINAQLFSDLPDGDYTLIVHNTLKQDVSKTFTVRQDAPGLFQWYPPQGSPTVAAFREDGSMLTADNPATLNETISIYGTGFGLYDRPLVDGFPTPDNGDWNLVDPIKVTVDGQTYTPVSARAANGFAGMVVLRVKLTGKPASGLVDLKVTVNNVDSNTSKLPIK